MWSIVACVGLISELQTHMDVFEQLRKEPFLLSNKILLLYP